MTVDDPSSADGSKRSSLVDQLVERFTAAIDAGTLPAGARLPSVRELARERSVSLFTAAEALSRLTAEGLVEARAGSGYYVASRGVSASRSQTLAREPLTDSIYGLRAEHSREGAPKIEIDAGCGWLEPQWCDTASVDRALRSFSRLSAAIPAGYGSALGLAALRTQLCKQLFARGIEAHEDQVLLTGGATQALDLIVSTLLKPGEFAIVERPCYPGLLALLRLHGVTPAFVSRTPSGPNVEELDAAAGRSKASVFFTNSTLHNPTGSTTSAAVAHAMLKVAARHGLTIVEDDLFWELSPRPPTTVASLDGLRSVVYVSGFSKSITPALRVGYLVGDRALVESIAATKIATTLGSSALAEGVVLEVLKSAGHRRHLPRLRQRLHDAHERVAASLKRAGFTLFCEPRAGLFLWAAAPADADVNRLASDAVARGILLAPEYLFGADAQRGGWFRFNVSYSDTAGLHEWLQSLAARPLST
jgi:DNA-binding transcriptional MocR family regulator